MNQPGQVNCLCMRAHAHSMLNLIFRICGQWQSKCKHPTTTHNFDLQTLTWMFGDDNDCFMAVFVYMVS